MTFGFTSVSTWSSSNTWFVTGRDDVGVGVEAGGADLDSHVGLVDFAPAILELSMRLSEHIACNQIVFPAGTDHGEHFAAKELAAKLGGTFDGEILFGGVTKSWELWTWPFSLINGVRTQCGSCPAD